MVDIFTCPGFRAAGVIAGLKKNGKKDLGLIVSEVPAAAAGVFTRNRVVAAPVMLDKDRVKGGLGQAIIVNSGNANCCTGEQGLRDARGMARAAADALGISEDLVLVASTGVIGEPLPLEKIISAIPELVKSLASDGLNSLTESILTTDTVPKIVCRQGQADGKTFTVTGVAKGSGMIRPDMATMLCFVCSDIQASPGLLQEMLFSATRRSFNRITVDGDTSTNDTILVLANGLCGAGLESPASRASFQEALDEVLIRLAKMVVKDGEGATKLVEIIVKGALSTADATRVAETVANSNLVKTALFGEDANWGRILAAAGRSGVELKPERLDVFFDEVLMVQGGVGCGKQAERRASQVLKKPEFSISIDLGIGDAAASVFTCDFSLDYVRINADYRS